MSSVWDMILQWGSTKKASIELPVATRHRRDLTEKLLKAMFNQNTHTHTLANKSRSLRLWQFAIKIWKLTEFHTRDDGSPTKDGSSVRRPVTFELEKSACKLWKLGKVEIYKKNFKHKKSSI